MGNLAFEYNDSDVLYFNGNQDELQSACRNLSKLIIIQEDSAIPVSCDAALQNMIEMVQQSGAYHETSIDIESEDGSDIEENESRDSLLVLNADRSRYIDEIMCKFPELNELFVQNGFWQDQSLLGERIVFAGDFGGMMNALSRMQEELQSAQVNDLSSTMSGAQISSQIASGGHAQQGFGLGTNLSQTGY